MVYISEMFVSLQGEGNSVGTKAVFIRLSGCSLRCPFCDSKHTWNKQPSDVKLTAEDVYKFVHNSNVSLVIFTGGEPILATLDATFRNLIRLLHVLGYKIQFETTFIDDQKSIPTSNIIDTHARLFSWISSDYDVSYVVSPKLNLSSYSDIDNIACVLDYYCPTDPKSKLFFNDYDISYKFVYDYSDIDSIRYIKELINRLSAISMYNVSIMPYTPQPFNYDTYIVHCRYTADAAMELNIKYSPRLQCDLWGDAKGK